MLIKKATPAQRLVFVIQTQFNISIKLSVTEVTLLNRLSSRDTRHFLLLIEKLRLSVVGNQHTSVDTIQAAIGLLAKYSFKAIQTVFNALDYYKLLDSGYLTHFIELMNSFNEEAHCQHFINIFNTHAYTPTLFMRRSSSTYRKEETLKPLLLLKGQDHKLYLIEHLFRKIAYTRYLAYHRHELLTLDFDALCNTFEIINLLEPLKLINDYNLRSILQHSRLAQNTNHSSDGLKVQLKLVSALRYSRLLTQLNIDQLSAIKLSATRLTHAMTINDLAGPLFYFIPVILDWSAHEILTQSMLNGIFGKVKSVLNQENFLVSSVEASLIKITLEKVSYNHTQRRYLATTFFEGSTLILTQIPTASVKNPMQLSP